MSDMTPNDAAGSPWPLTVVHDCTAAELRLAANVVAKHRQRDEQHPPEHPASADRLAASACPRVRGRMQRVEFHHSAEDFVEARRARDPVPGRRWRVLRSALLRRDPDVLTPADAHRVRGSMLLLGGLVVILASCTYLAARSAGVGWWAGTGLSILMLLAIARAMVRSVEGDALRAKFDDDPRNADLAAIEIDEQSFRFVAPRWRAEVDWPSVRRLIETNSLFLVTDDSPLTFVVPKRGFAGDPEREAFRSFVRSRIGDASRQRR